MSTTHRPTLTDADAPLRLHLHGAPQLQRGGEEPRLLERKHAALLAYLWREGPTPRARLAGLLWPEVGDERARSNLRQRLLKLRQEAGELVLDAGGQLALAPAVQVQPPLVPDATLLGPLAFDDCDALARWLSDQRDRDREARKRDWLRRVREAMNGRQLDDALYAADQLLQADRESEEAYRILMEVYYLRGDHAAALSAWDRCSDMLQQLYGVAPSAATRQLRQSLLAAAQQAQQAQHAHLARSAWAPTPLALPPWPVSVLHPPRLVGRSAALQALAAGWQAGHLLCVVGEAGVGKSRLLADWAASLPPAVAAVVAAARPGDALLPYAALSRLVLAAAQRFQLPHDNADAALAARLLPRLATLRGQPAAPVQTPHERQQALQALGRWLAAGAPASGRVAVLDDLQFADPASLAALQTLAEPVAAAPLRWVLALRGDEAGPALSTLLQALQAGGRCTRVDLAPLSAADAATLLAGLGLPHGAGWAAPIWQQVGGNPAFMLEAVKLLLTAAPVDDGAGAQLPQLPDSIGAVIERRLALLSPRARHLAQLAAIAGSGYSIPLAAAALACAPIELSEPLRELELRQVFQGRQFVHDVIASVTERSVPATVAEFMHRFVAEHLAQHGGEAAQIATHWLRCSEWRHAGNAFHDAARQAGAAALANEQAALLDQAIAAFERDPAAHDSLFTALEDRANTFEADGHEGLRPGFIARIQALARSEAQQLSALNHDNGWRANLAQPIEEDRIAAGIPRALAVGRPDLAFHLARMLALHWAMNNRADDALALLAHREAWVEAEADGPLKTSYRLTRSSIFAFGDRLPEAIAEGRQALAAAAATQDWGSVLPAMSNIGLMHYWRGEYPLALEVLQQARAHRERLYGGGGSGIKIDIHLGAVLAELGRHGEAQAMLEGALAEMGRWPDNDYRRTECLLADNHLAQLFIASGRADEAARVLAHDASGVADRFYGRRLALRLRWQRHFGQGDAALVAALVAELQALVDRLASPFNRALMLTELSRQQPPAQALEVLAALHDSPVAQQRPGLQLHAAALAVRAAALTGDAAAAQRWAAQARDLQARCAPFDITAAEVQALLAHAPG
jgi:DNA-binding SARP family transcriptional activator